MTKLPMDFLKGVSYYKNTIEWILQAEPKMNPGPPAIVCVYGCCLLSMYAVLYTLLQVTTYVLHPQLGCDIPGSVDH